MVVWLMVSRDSLALPLAVADTAEELGRIVGATVNTIRSTINHDKKAGRLPKYIKVECEDDEGE